MQPLNHQLKKESKIAIAPAQNSPHLKKKKKGERKAVFHGSLSSAFSTNISGFHSFPGLEDIEKTSFFFTLYRFKVKFLRLKLVSSWFLITLNITYKILKVCWGWDTECFKMVKNIKSSAINSRLTVVLAGNLNIAIYFPITYDPAL